MSAPTHVQTGAVEPIQVYIVDAAGQSLTGLTDLYVRVRRFSDGFYLDWNDDTFKSSGWTTLDQLLSEVDATNLPGVYEVSGGFDTSAITNPSADDTYTVYPLQTPGTNAKVPSPAEIKMGRWVDDVDDILTDTADMQPKLGTPATDISADISAVKAETALIDAKTTNLPADPASETNVDANETKIDTMQTDVTAILADTAAIDSRLPSDPADESLQQAAHAQTQADIAALTDIDIADVQTAMTNQGYTSGRAPNLDNLDAAVSSRSDFDETTDPVELLDSGGAAGTSAAELVTDIEADLASNHGSGQWDGTESDWTAAEKEQIRFRLAMDGTQTNPTTGTGTLEDILADTDAIDSRLPSDPADESLQQAAHAQTQADIAALNNPTVGDIADAVWDEDLSAHTGAGSAGEAQNRLDDILSDTNTMQPLVSTNLDATVSSRAVAGDAMDLLAGSVDANALDATAVAEIADGVWDEDITGHTGGTSAGAYQERCDVDTSTRAVPGDAMDLVADAVDASALATSGVDEIADAVWDEPIAGHAGAGSTGEALARVDVDVSTRAEAGDAMTLTPTAAESLVADVWDEAQADHLTAGSVGKSLDDAGATADPNAIADAVWDEPLAGHTGAGSMGQLQSRCDTPISTRAQPGDPMDLQSNAVSSTSLDSSAVDEIVDGIWDEDMSGHTGAGTAGEQQNRLDGDVTSRAAPGDAMDLVADALDSGSLADSGMDKIVDQVWEEAIADHSGTVGSTAEALASGVAPPTPAAIADAVWDEALSGHVGAGSTGEALGRVDVQVSSRAAPGAAMDLVNDAVDSSSLATSAAQEIRDQILSDSTPFAGANIDAAISSRSSTVDVASVKADTTAIDGRLPADPADESNQLAAHATTQAAIAGLNDLSAAEVEAAVWDAPHASHLAAGSTGKALEDAAATADPGAIADAVWDEAVGDHTGAGTMGEKQNAADSSDQIAGTATPWPPTPGSLLDRLANKNAGQTYDQATDSLEAARERIG